MVDCVAAVRRRETELLTQLRAAFAGDPAVQAFIADRSSIEATLQSLENTCQLTDIIVRERSVELLLLKDDIAQRMTSLLQTSLAQPPPHMRTSHIQFIPTSRNQPLPVGRLDFVDETVSFDDYLTMSSAVEMERGLRAQGDGHDSLTDDTAQSGGVGPEVEIKRRKMDSDVEVDDDDEGFRGEMSRKRLIATCETMTSTQCVTSRFTTMNSEVHVDDKMTATSSQLTVDQSTLTPGRAEQCHRATYTDCSKLNLTSQTSQTSWSVFQLRSKYVETEPVPLVNKCTSTEQPFKMDKVGDHMTSSIIINNHVISSRDTSLVSRLMPLGFVLQYSSSERPFVL